MNAPTEINRSAFLGSSDVAGILGVSPWDTPLTVFYKKVGWPEGLEPAADPERERFFRRGTLMEPVVRQMAQEEYGLDIVRYSTPERPNRYHNGWMAAEIDFEIDMNEALHESWPETQDIPLGMRVNCEVKTSSPMAAKKFGDDIGDVPMAYACQALWGQFVTGRKHTLFFVLVGSDTLLKYRVDRDEELLEMIVGKASSFWLEHVMLRVPPEPQTLADLDYLLPRTVSTKVVADAALGALYREYADIKRMEKIHKDRLEDLKFEIGSRMLGGEKYEAKTKVNKHVLVVDGREVLAVSYNETRTLDGDRVIAAFPEAAGMRKVSKYFRFDLPKSKEQ